MREMQTLRDSCDAIRVACIDDLQEGGRGLELLTAIGDSAAQW